MTGPADEVVIATKLFAPAPRTSPVERHRLYDRMRGGLGAPITLVDAPAGWGKSTLAADWLRHDGVRAGWVSLDRADDDPHRFWRYLLLAATGVESGTGEAALRRLDARGSDVERDVVPTFLNETAALRSDLVVVLDDYQLVTNPEVHRSVAALLERCPPRLHLMLLTRSDPPLPLSRLRVRGELVEVRADQLRFTVDEADDFVNERLGLSLSRADVERLVVRTEGWAAGLQLAALRLTDGADPSDFIARFTGADRHVVDYLGEEVLAIQPAPVCEFLLQTSILDRFCSPLCEAVTGRSDSADLLDDVYRSNLFLIPLDEERRWLRYHQLFRDILRHELARTAPEQVSELHRRAARWHTDAGDDAAAIRHSIAAGELASAATLVSAAWRRHFNTGQWETVRNWLDALPPELVSSRPELTIARVWIALDTGRLDEVDRALGAAAESAPLDGHVAVLRALHTYKVGDLTAASRQLRVLTPDRGDRFVDTVHCLLSGVTALWRGCIDEAVTVLGEAVRLADDDRNRLAYVYAQGCRALAVLAAGDHRTAEDLTRDAEAAVERTLSDGHFVAMFPALARARLAIARAEWDTANASAQPCAELAQRGAGRIEQAAAYLTATTAARAAGTDASGAGADASGAGALLVQARRLMRQCADPGPVLVAWLTREQRQSVRSDPGPTGEELTDRELAILRLLPGPLTQRELSSALFVTPNTLKTHLRAIYRKLGAQSRGDAVVRARSYGMI